MGSTVINDFEKMSLVRPSLTQNAAASNLAFNEKVKVMIASGRKIAHFAFGQSPFPIPPCLIEQLKKYAHVNSYLPMIGIPELRASLSAFHERYDGLNLDPENFIVAPGSKELIYLIMNIFNGIVLLPSPTWTTYEPQAYLSGKLPVILETKKETGWKVTPKVIEKAMKYLDTKNKKSYKLLILTNPGNPTGTCYTEEETLELSLCCKENNIIVLSDEIYSRLKFASRHCSMVKYYPEGTILTSGFSKWASAGGWRLGYAYIPSSLKTLYQAVRSSASHTYSCAPAPMQYAAANALLENADELEDYMGNCSIILNAVSNYCYNELLSVGVTSNKSEAGYYFMPDFEVIREGLAKKGITTGKQMTHAMMAEADVALMTSEVFLRPSSELSTRFCFVCFDGEKALNALKKLDSNSSADDDFVRANCNDLVDGVQRLKKFVEKYKNI